ncbi:MAG: MFS transporter [Candidatus Dormibacteraceae bacterium]
MRRAIRIRYLILILLCSMYFITYIDRTNIAIAGPTMAKDLHFNEGQLGLIYSAFSYPYALLQMPGGFVGDLLGPKLGLALVGVIWAVATFGTGFTRSLWAICVARAGLGFGEAAAFPTATRALSSWMPRSERGMSQGLVHAASRLGGAVTPAIVVVILLHWGWAACFYTLGVVSVVWLIVFLIFFRSDPHQDPRVGAAEKKEIGVQTVVARPAIPWGRLIAALWPVALCDFCYGWALWVYLTWVPGYLEESRHFPLASLALFAALPLVFATVGDAVGGVLSDQLLRRTKSLRLARNWQLFFGLLMAAATVLPAVVVSSAVLAVVFLSVSFFFLELNNPVLWSIAMDVAPDFAGTAGGLMNTGFGVAGILSPVIFGMVIDATGSWQLPFFATGGLMAVGAIVAVTVLRADRRVFPTNAPAAAVAAVQETAAAP